MWDKVMSRNREDWASVFSPVDAWDVDNHIYHVTTQLVGLHIHRTAVCRYVNLADHIKEKSLFNPRILQ